MKNYDNNYIAFISENEVLDKAVLGIQSDSLAFYLYNKNISKVLIYGHKNSYMFISILACLKAGITYIICDENLPMYRIKNIISSSKVNLALCTEDIIIDNICCIGLDEIREIISQNNRLNEYKYEPNSTAYIIYTSGSTGIPKGIEVTYANLENFLSWFSNLSIVKDIKSAVIINQALFSFDLSVADIFYSLYSKSTLYCLTKSAIQDFKLLFEHLEKSNAEMLIFTPSFIEMCLCDKLFNEELMPNLRVIFLCGEVLKPVVAKKLFERFKNVSILNAYGPSEATCCVTAVEITSQMLNYEKLPIGVINKSAVEIKIFDKNGVDIKDDSIGEIVLIGNSVAKGYCNYSDKGFSCIDNKPCYYTGDLGHIKDNMLFFDGRADNQIKYKGFRISLEDIENNMCKIDGVKDVRAFAKLSSNNEVLAILAEVVCDKKLDAGYIREKISLLLPRYMIPKSIKIVDKLTLNLNQKKNRYNLD